jgi:hypothetical protein
VASIARIVARAFPPCDVSTAFVSMASPTDRCSRYPDLSSARPSVILVTPNHSPFV